MNRKFKNVALFGKRDLESENEFSRKNAFKQILKNQEILKKKKIQN